MAGLSGLFKTAIALGAVFLLVLGAPADPVSASEHARRYVAAQTLEQALAAAAASERAASVPIAVQPEPEPVASGEIAPGESETIEASQIDATVEFSGHEVDETIEVTISELPGSAATTAAAEMAGVAVSAAFDVSAETSEGESVTSFPADPTIEEAPDGSQVVIEVLPGVQFEIDVAEAAIEGLDRSSLRILTREAEGEAWEEIPSYYDDESGTVKGEIDHLSQFVVIGTPFVPPPGPRIVLDPDDDVGHTVGPGGPMTELPQNVRLANELAEAMTEGCLADVVVTRTVAAPAFLSTATRAGMAAAHDPNLTITLAFNANVGFPWGTASDGGSIAFSRGGAADNAVRASLVAQLPGYTGRPAHGSSSASYPYSAFDGLPGAMVHLETLFIDHNFDRPVIDNGFGSIVDGVFTGLGVWLESQGFDCTDPATGGWPARPSAAELARWRNLGYQNYLTYGADPVSFSTGNLVEDESIFSLTGVGGQQIDITLVYNSQDGRLGRVGAGWTFGLGARAQRFDDGSVLIVRGDGASFLFEPDGTGGYDAEEGLYQTLTENGDGRLLLTSEKGESWLFNADDIEGIGELAEYTDRQGNTMTLGYATPDEDDQFVPLSSIADEAGQVIQVGHDALGRISSLTHPDGRTWTLGYDASGDLVSITNPDTRQRTFTYDTVHQMLAATDAAGITYLVNEYDASGRVVNQWDADENLRTFDYDIEPGVGGETTYTDNEGNETIYRFDEQSRITEIEDALGFTQQYVYDDADQVVAYTDQRGQTWEYEYDADGNIITETAPDGTAVHYTYTPTGEVASVTDEGGMSGAARTTTFDVDTHGRTAGVTRADGLEIANVFDVHGDLTATTDAAGGTTTFGYDARGNLASTTDPLGRTTTFGYDTANRLTSATDPAGGTTTFTWDAGDRLVSQTDPVGGVTTFTYDANDHPLTRTDPDGAVTSYEWDALFRVVSITAPDGGVTTFEYNTQDELVETTDAEGGVTTLALDDLYRPTTVTDANGEDWSRSYDPVGNVLSTTDPLGEVTSYTYDEVGRPTSTTDPLGGEFETMYDEVGRVVQEVDALGNIAGYAYDVLDRVVSVTDPLGEAEQYGYDPLGNVTEAIDRRGNSTTFVYDAASQLLSWAGPEGTGGGFGYDSRGNTVTGTDALNRTVTTTYDALNRPVSQADALGNTTSVSYDPMGRVAASTDGNGNVTVFDYDLAGRLVSSVDPLGNPTAYGHDLLGRQTSMLDAGGVRTVYAYDPLGQLTAVTEGHQVGPGTAPDINVTTSYTYTEVGNVATITDPKGAITSFLYDELGRTIQETNPLGNVWQYDYDAVGRLTTELDAKGQTTAYQYTSRSDVAVIDYASGANTTFLYDAAQNVIGMTDNLGASGWVYDDAGRLTQQTDSNGNILGYTYDATGARTELTLPTGTIGYEYDEAGRPVRQTSPWGALGYAYDSAGNLTDVLRSTGVTSEYVYDADNRVTGITHTSPGSELGCDLGANDLEVGVDIETLIDLELCLTVDIDLPVLTGLDYGDSIDLDYGYDQVGNVTSQARTDGSATAVTTSYGYDNLHRLKTSVATTGVNNTYTYDKAGNRTKWVTNHAPDTNGSLTVNGTYDAAGQLTAEAKTRPGLFGIPFTKTTNHSYDNNGNRTRTQTGGAITDYIYTPDDRVAEIDQGLREVEYGYDGLGRSLIEEVTSLLVLTEQTEQLWDGMVVVGQDSTAFGETSLVRDVTGDVAIQASDALLGGTDKRWGLTDRLGSTIGQGQGSKIGQLAAYSDWGVLQPGTIGWDSETGYTGELGDTTTGLWNFYARTYDPTAATWLQADPYRGNQSYPGTMPRYQYVTGNPTTFTDAYGYRLTQSGTSKYVGKSLTTCQREYGFCPSRNGRTVAGPTPTQPPASSKTTERHAPPPCSYNYYISNKVCTLPDGSLYSSAPGRATTSTVIDCSTDVRVGMDDRQVAINQACGHALSEYMVLTYGEPWQKDLWYLQQGINNVLQPAVPLLVIGTGAGVRVPGAVAARPAVSPPIGAAISGASSVQGRFPQSAAPNTTLVRRDSHGTVTNYQVYGPDGLPLKRVDLEGRPHGGVPTPHVQEFDRNTNPITGQSYVNPGTVREAQPWEVPHG